MNYTIRTNCGGNVDVDLKPCPFCGSNVDVSHIGNRHTKSQSLLFKCTNRSCRIERKDAILNREIDWLIPKSVEKWNTRKVLENEPVEE